MAQTTYPGDSNAFREQWPLVAPDDGIVDDYLGSAYTVTSSGSSPTVTVSPGPAGSATCRVAGFAHVFDAAVTLNLSTVPGATNPTGTQKRVDLIVVRYDWSVADQNLAATLAVRAGAPVAASVPLAQAVPAPVQIRGGIWEVPVRAVSRPAGGVVNASVDMRAWAREEQDIAGTAPLIGPVGAVRRRAATVWRRVLGEDSVPVWRADQVEANIGAYGEGQANITSGETQTIAIVGMTGLNVPPRGVLFCTVNVDMSAGNSSAGWIWIRTSGATEWSKQKWQFTGPQNGLVSFFFLAPVREETGIDLQVRASVDPNGTAVLFGQAKVMVGSFSLGYED